MAATVWRGRLAFGMVSIPVRLYKAARRDRIRFHHVYRRSASNEPESEDAERTTPAGPAPVAKIHEIPKPAPEAPPEPPTVTRVRNVPVDASTQTPLEAPRILKGYEIEEDRYVTFEPQEVAALRPRTSTELTIAKFVHLEEIDPIFFDVSYYAAADRGGERPYALLFRALADTGYAAAGSLAMHGREHATVIRPGRHGLILHTLFYDNEVRAEEEFRADTAEINPKELELAKTFVHAMAGPFEPEQLKDDFQKRLRELIQSRAESAIDSYEQGVPARKAPVVDIMEALRKSIEMAKKPPQRENVVAAEAKTAKSRRVRVRR